MSNFEDIPAETERIMLRSQIQDLFSEHAEEVGIAPDLDDPESAGVMVLAGQLDSPEIPQPAKVQIWDYIDDVIGNAVDIYIGKVVFMLSSESIVEARSREVLGYDAIVALRGLLKMSNYSALYSQQLVSEP